MPLFFSVFVLLLLAYFLGCCNGAILVSHFLVHDDVRSHGSGNAGLTNFYRVYGAKYALLVILFDMGKTVVSTLIGGYMFLFLYSDWTLGVLLGGLGCIIGHLFPAFYGFKGGKGILSGSMLVIMLDWRMALVAWGLFMVLWLITRYVSLGSISAAASVPISAFFLYDNPIHIVLCFVIAVLVIWSHRSNIKRLLTGSESKFKWHTGPTSDK